MDIQANKRLKLLELVKKDTNTVTVGEVAELFGAVIGQLEKHTNTFKETKAKLGEDGYVKFLHCIINSFTSSLYTSASKDEKEMEKRVKIVNDANRDLLIGMSVGVKKK